MYEKDGEKYFWDASPDNWVKGHEEYAKGWIECFHAYQGLGPPETHWPIEKFQKYTVEDFQHDVFEEGHVDKAVFQSTYLKEWYANGFNDIEQNAALLDRFPGKLIVNGRWDPRDGDVGLRQLEADHAKYGIQGVKLYTAEWNAGSRGWKLTDPEAVPFLDMCADLGIRNIHVHKGPTIWPLDKDAFDVSDVDHVATDYNGRLNFIIEHVGLPRIEEMPDDPAFDDFPRLGVEGKKKILGLNGAKLYGVDVPEELRLPVPAEAPASPESAVGVAG
jgi:hypothetical protein